MDLIHSNTYKNLLYNICILGCIYHPVIHKRVGFILKDNLNVCETCDMKCFDEDIKDNSCYLCRNKS